MDLTPAWTPSSADVAKANISHFMAELSFTNISDFHQWTITHYQSFWTKIINQLGIVFKKPAEQLCDLRFGIETPVWLPGAKMNIVDSCFTALPSETAIIYQDTEKTICKMTYAELAQLVNQIANSLVKQGYKAGDALAIIMPMNYYAVAIYLAVIKIGGVVVSIADSFSSQEIALRLNIAKAKAVFTQTFIFWNGKKIQLYEKICAADPSKIILINEEKNAPINYRTKDCLWNDFLVKDHEFVSIGCDPMSTCNILFSSGTTADPKAIPWNHTTPIKVASDAYFHQNIKPKDVLAWPTNLGWMMGPWLLFAALINKATLALYSEAPKDRLFGEFIQNAQVTMLGVVPTLVASWKQTRCMENLNWDTIKVFSSTGECSNSEDMLYLMGLANNKPIIEYCGGTEIGGAFISSTVIQNNFPTLFSTPTMGLNFFILNEHGQLADEGEVAIVPPSIGLSVTLLNANHHHVYFENMPANKEGVLLRRHGDQIKRLANGYYCILGRVDDTMNLGGIKISAAEIERTLTGMPNIIEVAAISITQPDDNKTQLIIYAATKTNLDREKTLEEMQRRISIKLNPLFKIHDLVFIDELPKTASNKIMRRMLRKNYTTK